MPTINYNILSSIIRELKPLQDDFNFPDNNHLYLSNSINSLAQNLPISNLGVPKHYLIIALYILTRFRDILEESNPKNIKNIINESGIVLLEDSTNFVMLKQGDIFQYIPYVDAMILFYAPNRCGFIGDLDYLDELCQEKKIERLKYDRPPETINMNNLEFLTTLRDIVERESNQSYFHYKVTLYANDPIYCKTTNILVVNTNKQDVLLRRKTNHGTPAYNRIYHTLEALYKMTGRFNVKSLALGGILCENKEVENELAEPMVDAIIQLNNQIERIVLADNTNIFKNIYGSKFQELIKFTNYIK